jgi:hypothetical protein
MTKTLAFEVYPSITTSLGSNWKETLADVKRLNLRKICLFLTGASMAERKKMYLALEDSPVKTIPLVHLRNDMEAWEAEYLMRRFKTQIFNVHSKKEYKFSPSLWEYSKRHIAMELTHTSIEDELSDYAGICLDVAHVENNMLSKNSLYDSFLGCLAKYPVKVWHVSAIKKKKFFWLPTFSWKYDIHKYKDLSEFDYITKYKKYLVPIIALELVNPIEEQLEAKEYVTKLLTL